jgi:FtsP/CotA-like multicopper oxidase with cupredoxin domain
MITDLKRARRAGWVGAIVAAGFALALAAPSFAGPTAPDVPSRIAPPAGHKPFLVAHATGVQIYRCDGVSWGSSTPRADLFGDSDQRIGSHYAGPTWEARDGSTVKATRVDGVTVDQTAIPWLLLKATDPPADAVDGRLADTTYIQRTATVGGIAPPATDCHAGTVGTVVEVPYTADYTFWKAQ